MQNKLMFVRLPMQYARILEAPGATRPSANPLNMVEAYSRDTVGDGQPLAAKRSDSLLNKSTAAPLNSARVYFPELSNECQVDKGPHVRTIGWLSVEHAFPTGEVPPTFIEKLRAHLQDPWQPVVTWGRYRCNLCPAHLSDGPISGSRNLWIPGEGVVYVAPELILHYIEAHHYKPPGEFILAVLNCP